MLSHGCIHLASAAAETYFATLSVGDVVQVPPAAVGARASAPAGRVDAGQRAMASAGSGRMPSRCARSTALTRSETPSFA